MRLSFFRVVLFYIHTYIIGNNRVVHEYYIPFFTPNFINKAFIGYAQKKPTSIANYIINQNIHVSLGKGSLTNKIK